jgi:hypothetical protein
VIASGRRLDFSCAGRRRAAFDDFSYVQKSQSDTSALIDLIVAGYEWSSLMPTANPSKLGATVAYSP